MSTARQNLASLAAALTGLALGGCYNTNIRNNITADATTSTVTVTTNSLKISNVSIAASGTGATALATQIYFDVSQSSAPVSNFCTAKSGTGTTTTKPCKCLFSWSEINTVSGNAVTIPRNVQSDVTTVQPSLVGCAAPGVYSTEIADGTTIKITVIPSAGNTETFSSSVFSFVKSKSSESGSFKDAQGRAFMNVLRYACHDQRYRGMSIQNKKAQRTQPTTGEASLMYPIANKFCVRKVNDTGNNAAEGCENQAAPDHSAQAAFYNLFIRESEVGDVNPGNGRYTCPTVTEALGNNGTVGSQGKYWPLDSTFALSMGKTADFSVGVVANSRTSSNGDPVSQATSCDPPAEGSSSTPAGSNTLVRTCLGFAAKPNADGTCPYIRDTNGAIRFTYRLRRYVAILPPAFDTDGSGLNEPQATDTVYVVDRPVNATTNPDPLKPYTMRGPKPCPYSYFDNKKVLDPNNAAYFGSYASTYDSRWTGTNVDGIQFPNTDSLNSCSAALPLVADDRTNVTITTVNAKNLTPDSTGKRFLQRVYIRPTQAFFPHYEEDTDFQACAPLSNSFRDPPLHFSKNLTTGNVAWCAEAYPSQNNNVSRIDPHTNPQDLSSAYTGSVRPFTSHVVKNSASAPCSPTPVAIPTSATVPNIYPLTGLARHLATDIIDQDKNGNNLASSQTCDRTVVNPLNGVSWPRFPLLSPAAAPPGSPANQFQGIEEALSSNADTSYQCTVTFDGTNGAKTGKYSPSQGCCGVNTQVWTGLAPAAPNNARNAHLEPDAACLVPGY